MRPIWNREPGTGPNGSRKAFRSVLLMNGFLSGFLLSLLVVLLAGCGGDTGSERAELPDVDYLYFVARVQPILERKCAFFACHGGRDRLFQVYAVTRLREIPDPDPIFEAPRPLTPAELDRNFRSAAGMLYGFDDPEKSLLFSKLVEGGTRHAGATLFGGPNVFESRRDPDYQTLLEWARGARIEEEK